MKNDFVGLKMSICDSEVAEYLETRFNSLVPRFKVLSKSVFSNATIAKFDNVCFIICRTNECLEISFAKKDTDSLKPIIHEILKWEPFKRYPTSFYVKVDKDCSRSILFDKGRQKSPSDYKSYFQNFETEVILMGE